MAAPVIKATVVDVDPTTVSLTGNNKTLIKFHSNAQASMTVTSADGAINNDLYIIRNGSRTGYGTSCTFDDVENNVFMFSCEDEYGNIGTAVVQPTMIPYVRLTCNIANNKPDGDGNMRLSCSGNYFNDSFGAIENSLTVTYSYTGSDGRTGSGNMSVSKYGNAYSAYVNLSGLNYEETYTFVITATDELETATSRESGVTSLPLFHWGKDDFTFEVPVRCKGDLRLKGEGNFGNTLYFGDGEYCYLREEPDDVLTIKAGKLNIIANNISGTWTPTVAAEDSGAVDGYDVQKGWYQKLGNVVTIGWLLKVNINPEYFESAPGDPLTILGIPSEIRPSVNAFGGGVAHRFHAANDCLFEGWCINTGGAITARLQPISKDEYGNLQITDRSYYPNQGGLMTLAGTICYMTNS